VEQIEKDIERDKILSADQAKEYGLIDEVLISRKASSDA
jgi:Protease subunit of ATP-dependent Clp proteases